MNKWGLRSALGAAALVCAWLLLCGHVQIPPQRGRKSRLVDVAYEECTRELKIPKVALLFLAHQQIQQKPVWRAWLKQAVRVVGGELVVDTLWVDTADGMHNKAVILYVHPAQVPSALLFPHIDGVNSTHFHRVVAACHSVGRAYTQPHRQQMLFSLYLHNSPDAGLVDADEEHQLQHRLHTQWGSITLVEAERRLLQTALKDPLNHFFTMLSDTSVPLYPPLIIYQQLLLRQVSAINACPLYYNPFAHAGQYDSWHRYCLGGEKRVDCVMC